MSKDTVWRTWRAHGLAPWRYATFKPSNDPAFEEKLVDPAAIVLAGHHDNRLEVGIRLGATHTVNTSSNGDLAEVLGGFTDGHGPQAVIDAVSSSASMALSTQTVQAGGTVSWVGMEVFLGAPEIDWDQCFMRNLTIRGAVAPVKRYLPELWPLLESGAIDPSPVLTHDLALDGAAAG